MLDRPTGRSRTPARRGPTRLFRLALVGALLLLVAACSSSADDPPHAVFFGLDVPDSSPESAARIASSIGAKPTVASIFVKFDSTFTAASLTRIAGPDGTPFITLEPWLTGMRSPTTQDTRFTLASIIDGDHDQALHAIAQKIADYRRPVYLRFAYEMNGNWYPWAAAVNGNSPAQYQSAWRHVHDLFQPVTKTQVRWVFSPAAVQSVPSAAPAIAQLYPGDAYVDYVGMSGYNHGVATATQTLQPTLAQLTKITAKPIILSEIGSSGPRKAQWLASLPTLLESNSRIKGFIYFSTSPATTGATGDYSIESDAGTVAAFRNLVHTIPLTSSGTPTS